MQHQKHVPIWYITWIMGCILVSLRVFTYSSGKPQPSNSIDWSWKCFFSIKSVQMSLPLQLYVVNIAAATCRERTIITARNVHLLRIILRPVSRVGEGRFSVRLFFKKLVLDGLFLPAYSRRIKAALTGSPPECAGLRRGLLKSG